MQNRSRRVSGRKDTGIWQFNEHAGQLGFLYLYGKGQGLSSGKGMYIVRAVRKALSYEQHQSRGWKTCLGWKLYPLHGLYLRMPGRVHRIQKRQQKAPALLVRKIGEHI